MSLNVSLTPLAPEEILSGRSCTGRIQSSANKLSYVEALRLLKRREELWKVDLEEKVQNGMSSLRAGHTIPAEEVWAKLGKSSGRRPKKSVLADS